MDCPLCGENELPSVEVPGILWIENALTYHLNFVATFGPKEARLVDICLRFWPRVVSYQRCAYALWYDDDEPESWKNILSVHACHIRNKMSKFGLEITSANRVGYRFFLPQELKLLPESRLTRRFYDIPPDLDRLAFFGG